MKTIFCFTFFLFFTFLSFSQQKEFTAQDTLRGMLSPQRAGFDVHFYELSLSIDPARHFISGKNAVYYTATQDISVLQLDLAQQMKIRKITDYKDRIVTYSRKGDSFFVTLNESTRSGEKSFITIFYEGEPRTAVDPPWDGGFVWSSDSLDRPWVGVACEGVGASVWWPCKDHPTDEPDSVQLNFEVPEQLFCASNGNLVNSAPTAHQTRIYTWKVSYPINAYNVTLNIGHYVHLKDVYLRKDNTSLALDYYVLSYNREKAQKHFEQVKPMLECYEKLWGKYPFEKDGYALIESPYWGMEHQSAIAYGNRFRNNMVGLDYIIVHESGHEWWGNHVSASDHADLWIHEAFTTYGETLLLECLYGIQIAEKYLTGQKRLIKNKEPIVGPYGVNYHYWEDSDMYYKGAWMLHTLRNSLYNDSLWFELLKNIQTEFGHKQISSQELIEYINGFTNYDYTSFFAQYLLHTRIPILQYKVSKKDKHTLKLKFRWKADVSDFSMPLVLNVQNNRLLKIYPNSEFQTIFIPVQKGKPDLYFSQSSFYVELVPLNKP